MKCYKVFKPDWTCKGFQYEVGKTYEIKGNPVMCKNGFHACKKVSDCFSYYSFDPNNKVAEVELSGIVLGEDDTKQCGQRITILKEILWNEMLILANTGIGNSGHSNSGDSNSGHSNSGDSNSGHRNSGHSNSGDSNSGHWNSGDWNSGDWNSGFFNSQTPKTILVFNKPCDRDVWDKSTKPDFLFSAETNMWISWSDMSEDEKKDNKNAFVTNGYLKVISYKEAWASAFKNASKRDIKLLKALPNFDAEVFEEITGIKIN